MITNAKTKTKTKTIGAVDRRQTQLAKYILPFPEHTCYVEPFCGAAALFFVKIPSKVEALNDVSVNIVNLYRVVKHHFSELYSQFKWVLISRENWETLNRVPPDILTDIQRAARFLYLQKMAFGTSTTSPPKFNLLSKTAD